jgi:hypothetical protein
MAGKDNPAERIRMRTFRMHALATGIAAGVVCGLGLFAATLWLVLKGGEVVGPHLALLGQYFIGYSVSWPGSFIGLLYGFLAGFLLGYVTSQIYNLVAALKSRL